MVSFELPGEMRNLLEAQFGAHGFDAADFFQAMAGRQLTLFIEPFLNAAPKSFLRVAAQLPCADAAQFGERFGFEPGLLREFGPMMEVFYVAFNHRKPSLGINRSLFPAERKFTRVWEKYEVLLGKISGRSAKTVELAIIDNG